MTISSTQKLSKAHMKRFLPVTETSTFMSGKSGHARPAVLSEYSSRILYNWQVAVTLYPLFAVQEALYLAVFVVAAWLTVLCSGRLFRPSQLEPAKIVLIQLLVLILLKIAILNLLHVSVVYPRGISQLLTGLPAIALTLSVAKAGNVQMKTKGRQVLVAVACELLNLFYAMCLIAPIALDPVY